jgi:hypothetical protein
MVAGACPPELGRQIADDVRALVEQTWPALDGASNIHPTSDHERHVWSALMSLGGADMPVSLREYMASTWTMPCMLSRIAVDGLDVQAGTRIFDRCIVPWLARPEEATLGILLDALTLLQVPGVAEARLDVFAAAWLASGRTVSQDPDDDEQEVIDDFKKVGIDLYGPILDQQVSPARKTSYAQRQELCAYVDSSTPRSPFVWAALDAVLSRTEPVDCTWRELIDGAIGAGADATAVSG